MKTILILILCAIVFNLTACTTTGGPADPRTAAVVRTTAWVAGAELIDREKTPAARAATAATLTKAAAALDAVNTDGFTAAAVHLALREVLPPDKPHWQALAALILDLTLPPATGDTVPQPRSPLLTAAAAGLRAAVPPAPSAK